MPVSAGLLSSRTGPRYRIDNHSHHPSGMYARYFHDRLDFFADALVDRPPADAGPTVAGANLVDGGALDTLLSAYAQAHGINDRRAAATDWSKFFFARLIIPTVVIQTGAGRPLDLDPAHWQLHYREDGTAAYFVFDREPLIARAAPGDMASLIDTVMSPLMAALAADCGLSPRVFASNAAMYYAWALDQLDEQNRAPAAARQQARALLEAPKRPNDDGDNPFHAPFKSLAAGARDGNGEPTAECRRLCCVRDLDPTLALCANCPRVITYAAPADTQATSHVS
ncbi:siderophore-iron reductase FhuF [Salinisphaera sp. SPP-AMP-43]|uniref:siderophore-iron reductase FhuF n=1 Tax=Salinisphaera sp. SPP-AMP-43 TaxID=3121288 RepID=UPI003C6E794D